MKNYLAFELKKFKGSGIIVASLLITLLIVSFQGYLGLIETSIPSQVVYITALDLYTKLMLPTLIGLMIGINFYRDIQQEGLVSYYFNSISINKFYKYKITILNIYGISLFIFSLLIASIFVFLRGSNPIDSYIQNWPWIILSLLSVIIIVNLQILFTIIFKNHIIPILICITFSLFGTILNSFNLWLLNPWGYINFLFGYKTINFNQLIAIFIICGFSILLLFNKRKKGIQYLLSY